MTCCLGAGFRWFGILLLSSMCAVGCTSNSQSESTTKATAGAGPAPSTPGKIQWEKYSDAVFARAKAQNKLVIMDLEAVWCHWCHVQDEITYSDPDVIAYMNRNFIAVKVDQDSRPDLSNRYEDYGWPATIVFNNDGVEIVKRAGYIPPKPMLAMLTDCVKDPTPGPSAKASNAIEFNNASSLTPELRKELIDKLAKGYDSKQGGWGFIHKFVDWDAVEFTLIQAKNGDKDAENRVRQTLDGGLKIIDPAWGGVYQYSTSPPVPDTDADWDHPHFEKLMQFQAEMMRIYVLADAQLNEPKYRKAAASIRGYIANFLTSLDGAFYVSQDADLVEGQHSGEYFKLDDAGRRKLGIPRVDKHEYARETGWGIQGLLVYYTHVQDPANLDAAKKAAHWVIDNRSIDGGGFSHDKKDAAGPYLGDTLSMGRAFLALYEATADRQWLKRATAAADFITAHFRAGTGDSKSAAGFATAAGSMSDLLRPKPQVDENVSAARFFNLLHYYTGRKQDTDAANEAMRYLAAPQVARGRGLFLSGILLSDIELNSEPLHVTVVGKKSDNAARDLFMQALKAPASYRRMEWWDETEGPLTNADVEYPTLPKAAAFICTGNTCSSPLQTPKAVAAKLKIPQ